MIIIILSQKGLYPLRIKPHKPTLLFYELYHKKDESVHTIHQYSYLLGINQ